MRRGGGGEVTHSVSTLEVCEDPRSQIIQRRMKEEVTHTTHPPDSRQQKHLHSFKEWVSSALKSHVLRFLFSCQIHVGQVRLLLLGPRLCAPSK